MCRRLLNSIISQTRRLAVTFPVSIGAKEWLGAVTLILCLWTGTVFAQVTASITGTVKDSSGAVVQGATITVKSLESGLTRTAESDASGNFSVPSLPVGQY